jgi:5-methylcytosine-specific restriction protein A
MRNPKWSRDELILALDLYFRVNPIHTSEKNPDIKALSDTLNSLPVHPQVRHGEKFRNPNGVYMKLCNFLRFDPNYNGIGLTRGGKLEKIIWNEFSFDKTKLARVADSIRSAVYRIPPPGDSEEAAIDEEEEFPEGRLLTQLHKRRERNPFISKKKKKKVLHDTGVLACEICEFDFFEVYGKLGKGFAECHHRLPLSDLATAQTTKLSDSSIVCSNCHRMHHRVRPWKTVNELREIFIANKPF